MNSKNQNTAVQRSVSRAHDRSLMQKWAFCLGHFALVICCVWLAIFDGWSWIGDLFGQKWVLSDPLRATILVACAFLYWSRHVVTLFYLLVRRVEWAEAIGLLSFMAFFEIGLVLIGGGALRDTQIAISWLDGVAFFLLIVGSYFNSFSEIQRKWWKKNPENKGHCYTGGLFRHSMHINYFGDLILFTGWCLFTHNLWTLGLPIFMMFLFIFLHIPDLDEYLAGRYGEEFEDYAKKTKRLIPFVY